MGIVQTDEEQSCIQDGRRGRRNGQTPEQWFGEYEETYKKSIKINPRTIVVLIAKREESGHASMAALQDNNEA